MSPTLKPLEAFRDRMVVFTGLDNFPATDQGDVGGQHPRAAPAFMSGVHPKQTEGADVQAGTTIDQIIAEQICRDTKLPSLELAVDRNDVVGACDHGYACAYMNCMSWGRRRRRCRRRPIRGSCSSGCSASAAPPKSGWPAAKEDRSILDGADAGDREAARARLGARDRAKLGEYSRRRPRRRAAHREGRVDQQRLRGAAISRSACPRRSRSTSS